MIELLPEGGSIMVLTPDGRKLCAMPQDDLALDEVGPDECESTWMMGLCMALTTEHDFAKNARDVLADGIKENARAHLSPGSDEVN